MDHWWIFGWFGLCLGTVMLLAALVPLTIRKLRLAYSAFISLLLLVLLSVIGLIGLRAPVYAGIHVGSFEAPTARVGFNLSITSRGGGIRLNFDQGRTTDPAELRQPAMTPRILWAYSPGSDHKYPHESNWPNLVCDWHAAGFQLIWRSAPATPIGWYSPHFVNAIFPAFVPVPFLLILPFLYVRRRILIPRHRRKHNLCLACGYSLTGNVSGVCPECAAAVPVRKSDNTNDSPKAEPL